MEAVEIIRQVSIGGRAPRQTPTLTALAVCAMAGDAETKAAANAALPAIARIPTHLFEYLENPKQYIPGTKMVSTEAQPM